MRSLSRYPIIVQTWIFLRPGLMGIKMYPGKLLELEEGLKHIISVQKELSETVTGNVNLINDGAKR